MICSHCTREIEQLRPDRHDHSTPKFIGYDGRHYDHPYWFHVQTSETRASFWCDRSTKVEATPLSGCATCGEVEAFPDHCGPFRA